MTHSVMTYNVMNSSFVLFVSTVIVAVILTGIYRLMAIRFLWLAVPEERSSHATSTPRSAGLIILLISGLFVTYQFFSGNIAGSELLVLSIPTVIGLIGLVDDAVSLSSKFRFIVYTSLITLMVLAFLPLRPFNLLEYSITSAWLLVPLYVIALTWLVNLFNFMDGINGIAGGQFLFVMIAAFFMLPLVDFPHINLILVMSAAVIGFMWWNFPSGKVFMGDVGSTFLAAMIGWFILLSIDSGQASPWFWVILLASFVVDASYTLVVRICTGQQWHSPHASHCYQILARRWSSHTKVVGSVMLVNLLWLWPLAWLANNNSNYELFLVFLAYVPLIIVCVLVGAGKKGS